LAIWALKIYQESGVAMICPKCAASVKATDRFCEACGYSLTGATPVSNTTGMKICHCPPGEGQPDEDGYCLICGVHCLSEAAAARNHVEQVIDDRLAVVSDIGRRHTTNEDAGAVTRNGDDTAILIVADGVSSSADSASASSAIVTAAMDVALGSLASNALSDVVRASIIAANEAVLALPYSGGEDGDGPESTVVAAICRGSRATVGWAGDSRAYLIGSGTEKLLTRDDSWVEEAVRSGLMTREQAIVDKRAHYVTQVLGMRDQSLDPHVIECDIQPDQILLLCSDGLWNYFEEVGELATAIQHCASRDALSLCRYLVASANEHGGHDNVTVAALMPQ
jgi:PPM family protein phosphatase